MKQRHSSKNTSINTTRLPAVYNKVDWSRYTNPVDNYCIVDIGCGCIETQKLIRNKLKSCNIRNFYPWDPYHKCIVSPVITEHYISNPRLNKVVICSNVLNVIDDDTALMSTIQDLCNMIVIRLPDGNYRMNPCYVTVYEGNKSGIGRETKKDCWQRNECLSLYLRKFNDYIKNKYNHNSDFFKIKYGMIIGVNQYTSKQRWYK